jgi:hypothetical protein
MKNDPLCIKEDVCDMAVCDGVSSCSHAVLKTAVLAQQSTNKQSGAIKLVAVTCVCPKCGTSIGNNHYCPQCSNA